VLPTIAGCHHADPPRSRPRPPPVRLPEDPKRVFLKAAELFDRHERAGRWTAERCAQAAAAFGRVPDAAFPGDRDRATRLEALYNAAVAHRRCRDDAKAKPILEEVLRRDPKFHRARTQLALLDVHAGGAVGKAIAELQRAIADAEFKNIEALVHLAALQMRRGNEETDEEGASDFERAKANIQRALAIDDGFMPAFNQLALYYLESAKKKQRPEGSPSAQALELALLVCGQAIQRDATYAPIRNTLGLVASELGDFSQASAAFGEARTLDPQFFEAHMNYAAVNLQFRNFAEAERAYRAAIGLRERNYDAHLGLALALRAQIGDTDLDAQIARVGKELDLARAIDPNRPESYFNAGVLTEELKTKTVEGPRRAALLREAKELYRTFIDKARSKASQRGPGSIALAAAVARAEQRISDVDVTLDVIRGDAPKPSH
jgi:Tfp pilus assembly protein PilF